MKDLLEMMGEAPARRVAVLDEALLTEGSLWADRCAVAIEVLAARTQWFTADDVRELAGEPPPGIDPRAIGGHLRSAAASGTVEPVPGGYVNTRRKSGHMHPQRAWRGVMR